MITKALAAMGRSKKRTGGDEKGRKKKRKRMKKWWDHDLEWDGGWDEGPLEMEASSLNLKGYKKYLFTSF